MDYCRLERQRVGQADVTLVLAILGICQQPPLLEQGL